MCDAIVSTLHAVSLDERLCSGRTVHRGRMDEVRPGTGREGGLGHAQERRLSGWHSIELRTVCRGRREEVRAGIARKATIYYFPQITQITQITRIIV